MKLGISIIVSCLLSGCSTLLPIQVTDPRTGIEYTVPARLQDVPGIKDLAEACATKAERVIHRTVEVDGYYLGDVSGCDEACWRDLSRTRYRYFEFNVPSVKSWDFLQEIGLWRVSKEALNDERCKAKPTNYMKPIADRDGWNMDFCLAFERIEYLISQYEAVWIEESTKIDNADVKEIVVGRSVIRDRASKEELGYSVSATLFLGNHVRSNQRSFSCASLGIEPLGTETGYSLRYEVLK